MRRKLLAVSALGFVLLACGDSGTSAGGAGGTAGGGNGGNTGGTGGIAGGFSTTGGSGGNNVVECTVPCEPGQICTHGTCIEQQPCSKDDDCDFDTYCDEASMLCIPWDTARPGADENCAQISVPGLLSPKVRCEFSAAPANDAFPNHVDVQGTPVVVNFNTPASSGPPSIAASFTATVINSYTEDLGVIRVLKGTDCSLETNLGGSDLDGDSVIDWTVSSASLAVADLDGDSSAEIVAYGADGSTLAFTRKLGVWSLLWKAPYPAGAPWSPCNTVDRRCSLGWAGASIHDLDDDGTPEIIREGVVFSSGGGLVSLQPAQYASYSQGVFPVLANLDEDAPVEFTNGARVWEWNQGWVLDAGYPESSVGLVAVADFGAYGVGPGSDAEIAIVTGGTVLVRALDGSLVMGPVVVPGNNPGGGPPTVSDFDGDGLVEVGVAGRAYYTVFDIDCGPNPRPGGSCNLGSCDALNGPCTAGGSILWSQATQDISSNVTGSSIFDFEADGKAEVVYGDECFTRIYDGETGDVLFSQYRSSCTWYENPIIADADGNFRADLITPSNKACSPTGDGIACGNLTPEGVDSQWPGVRCQSASDCVSGTCDQGLCRCVTSSQCCGANDDAICVEQGLQCAPPPAGTAGSGNTCRASHPHGVSGIRVYSDANDQWVRSRTIWNQHAYHVTHIGEDAVVPQTSMWDKNWEQPELNNFRQNVPGGPFGTSVPDSTAGAALFDGCLGGQATLTVDVCNRGSAPQGAGIVVGFYVDGMKICETSTSQPLAPEECESVSCVWATPPGTSAQAVNVDVVANDGGAAAECHDNNNGGIVLDVWCQPPS